MPRAIKHHLSRADILTGSPTHPHGIKVRLEGGEVGRVKRILGE
ncbi:MAG: DUF2196 domain-containing protein [Spirochaetes bacterium]|nr:DUF2196 domain-containing protein [Spirochaetota bacterium]